MATTSPNNFLFLNGEGNWPHFSRFGLEIDGDGTLQLSRVPRISAPLSDEVRTAPTPDGPAGLALDHGTLYFSQPGSNTVSAIHGCDASQGALLCVRGGMAGAPGLLNAPRGLLIPPNRRVLFVADSGNHRIQIFDLDSHQLMEIWGASAPMPSADDGSFNTPWAMAADHAGNVYIVDYGNHRVQKFNFLGDVLASFEQNVAASGGLRQPVDIAVSTESGKVRIFVADASSAKIFVFDEAGNPAKDSSGNRITISDPHLTQPMGLAIAADALYVGDNAARRIFRFQLGEKPVFVGQAIGYDGPVACLLVDQKGNLWVQAGGALAPVSLSLDAGYGALGALWNAHPISVGRVVQWHRLQALLQPLAPNTHLDLFAYASDKPTDPPAVDPNAVNPFSDARWNALSSLANIDLTDIYLRGAPKQYLWVGALFTGDGGSTPELSQLRLEYDWPTYDAYLPAIYRNPGKCGDFLPRLLALFQSFHTGIEYEIDTLAALFDPKAARPSFLPWLAGCLGLDLEQNWSVAKQREILARIFEYYGKRGTAEGLREALRLFAGIDAQIDEPILHASWWALPGTAEACCDECAAHAADDGSQWTSPASSALGWTTMLPPAQPQGAVVGTTAVLDQSHVISEEDFGAPLFTDVAYQFRVSVFRSQASSPDALATIRAILDSEKPAHTMYELCVIEPAFRVGFQSSVGVDSVVGGPPRELALGSDQSLGVNTALGGMPPNRIGESTRLGVSTRLA
jgi:phage tail-like protein